jgi:hypothetical protein
MINSQNNKMKKLDNISKKEIFIVPDEYFEQLPSKIQNRIIEGKTAYAFTFFTALKYALPAILIAVLAGVWFYPSTKDVQINAETMLSAINTEDLVAYLNDADISTDEVLESVDFTKDDLDEIEASIYDTSTNDESFKNFIEEID